MRKSVGFFCFVFSTCLAPGVRAAINDGSNGGECDLGHIWDGKQCIYVGTDGGDGEIIDIEGDASCPAGHVWNGHHCVWWTGGSGPDPSDPTDDNGAGAGGDDGPVCTPEEVCHDCKAKNELCGKKAAALASNVRTLLETQALQKCSLNAQGRSPGQAEAKGGYTIADLAKGKNLIAGYGPEQWDWSCEWDNESSHKPIFTCEGPAETSCMDSYRADLPAFANTKNATMSLELSAGWMGLSAGTSTGTAETITYQYGGSTGYASAVHNLEQALLVKCGVARDACEGGLLCKN